MSVAACLGRGGADVFLLDEPSAHMDCEQRVLVAKVSGAKNRIFGLFIPPKKYFCCVKSCEKDKKRVKCDKGYIFYGGLF